MTDARTRLDKLLSQRGYCSRRETIAVVRTGLVTIGGTIVTDPELLVDPLEVRFDGAPLDPGLGMTVLLNKPSGYVCSQRDREATVFEILPPRFGHRNPRLGIVGRLDKDTTGLLLLTDDGTLLHRLTSPKYHVEKSYLVTLAHPLRGDEADHFASGTLLLQGESEPLLPATLTPLSPLEVELVITEGRFHQVKRMFAAVGNQVVALHRRRVGPLELDNLALGTHRILSSAEYTTLRASVELAVP